MQKNLECFNQQYMRMHKKPPNSKRKTKTENNIRPVFLAELCFYLSQLSYFQFSLAKPDR